VDFYKIAIELLLIRTDGYTDLLTFRIRTLVRVGLLQAEGTLGACCLGTTGVDEALVKLREITFEHRDNEEDS
jgi:hypothetical protein